MKIINMMGPPCTHKSTVAAGLYYLMKKERIRVELVTEFAKDMVWEGHWKLLEDQLYVLAEQNRRLNRLRDKVDYVITDSPLLLSAFYKPETYPESFDRLVVDMFHSYVNEIIFLHRVGDYDSEGRLQMEQEADALVPEMLEFLHHNNLPYMELPGDDEAPLTIMKTLNIL